jgi:HSP20 family protein
MFSLIPWRETDRRVALPRREIDRLFDRFLEGDALPDVLTKSEWMPSVDVSETAKEIIVNAELPGMNAEDIDISLSGDALVLRGERKHEHEEKKENYHRVERRYGSFSRTLQLPAEVDREHVDATYKDGVLKVTLQKTEESSTKKIKVKAA